MHQRTGNRRGFPCVFHHRDTRSYMAPFSFHVEWKDSKLDITTEQPRMPTSSGSYTGGSLASIIRGHVQWGAMRTACSQGISTLIPELNRPVAAFFGIASGAFAAAVLASRRALLRYRP